MLNETNKKSINSAVGVGLFGCKLLMYFIVFIIVCFIIGMTMTFYYMGK